MMKLNEKVTTMRQVSWISVFVILLLTGCNDDFLQTTPTDELSPETFYENEQQVKQGVMGIYNSMAGIGHAYGVRRMHTDFGSDNNYNFHGWQGNQALGNWTMNSTNRIPLFKWQTNYRTISRANAFLDNLEEVPISEDAKINYRAEARFLRAHAYADLIQYFGDVPLIKESLTLDEAEVPRTSKEKVLEFMVDDFDFAIQNLPETTETGRATKGAALAYKARYMLYNERYEEAADAAKSVIDMGIYSLFPDYEGIHKVENENNEEIIFAWQFMPDQQAQPWPSTCLQYSVWWTQGVTLDIVESYYMQNGMPINASGSGFDPQDPAKDRDPRLNQTFVLPGDQIGKKTLIPDEDVFIGGIRIKKYNGIQLPDMENCHLDWVEMRYADVLLIRAEALIEMGNTGQEVYSLINQVRQRPTVNMPRIQDAEGSGLSQNELREILRHERRVEFAMEGTRYEDMQRWECEECVKEIYGYNKEKLSDPNDAPDNWFFEKQLYEVREFDPAKGWLWPIPQQELQNNPELEQNPGY